MDDIERAIERINGNAAVEMLAGVLVFGVAVLVILGVAAAIAGAVMSAGFGRPGRQRRIDYACAVEGPRRCRARRFFRALVAFLLAPTPLQQPRRNRK